MNYHSISSEINKLIQNPLRGANCYEDAVKELRRMRDTVFTTLQHKQHPMIKQLNEFSANQLAFIIIEYSCFSNNAKFMLLEAQVRNHDWKELREELAHNIAEEMGLDTKGIPHLEMMRQGYRMDLGIETDQINHTDVTKSFINKMMNIFSHDDNAYNAGALLAFEGTAIAEFYVIDDIIKKYKEKTGENLLKGSLTNLYVDGHKFFEIGHEDGLKNAIKPYINDQNVLKFIKGYLAVCMTMTVWWEQLTIEAFYRLTKQRLIVKDTEFFDVAQVFTD